MYNVVSHCQRAIEYETLVFYGFVPLKNVPTEFDFKIVFCLFHYSTFSE